MIFAFTPLLVGFWTRQSAKGAEPNSLTKMAIGCLFLTLANLVMVLVAFLTGDGKASWLWLVVYVAVVTLGEIYLSPISLSLYSKVSPPRFSPP
jgi:POT family proton-dependent oligopeptide transporter